jgi:hypothetical protein
MLSTMLIAAFAALPLVAGAFNFTKQKKKKDG